MDGIAETDCSDIFKDVFSDIIFKSFAEFEQQFNEFKKRSGSVYRVKTSCSVETENKSREVHLPSELRYSSVTYVCVHYGEPRKNGTSQRIKQRYLPCGCQSLISLPSSKTALKITR